MGAAVLKEFEEKKADYLANKEERDAKAFEIVDKDGSGCLDIHEFLNMMDCEKGEHFALMKALGLHTNRVQYYLTLRDVEWEEKMIAFLESKASSGGDA